MCIICFKDSNIQKPSVETLEECFYNNPHGAGIAIMKKDHIKIKKGLMTFSAFLKANEEVKDNDTVAYHFRIATSGGINKGLTHPFPVTNNEKILKATVSYPKAAFIHNGVIGKGTKNLSDTALYVKDTLSHFNTLLSPKALKARLTVDTVGSRTIFMDSEKQNVILTGAWVSEKNGLKFSNTSYKPKFIYSYTPKYYTPKVNDYNNFHHAFIDCVKCGKASRLISDFWGLYECTSCHEVTDYDGNEIF